MPRSSCQVIFGTRFPYQTYHAFYLLDSSHPLWFADFSNIWERSQVLKLLSMKLPLSLPPCQLSSSAFNAKDRVCHPYTTISKINLYGLATPVRQKILDRPLSSIPRINFARFRQPRINWVEQWEDQRLMNWKWRGRSGDLTWGTTNTLA